MISRRESLCITGTYRGEVTETFQVLVNTDNLGGKGYVIRDTNENKVVRCYPDHIFRGGNHGPPADIAETVVQQASPTPAPVINHGQLLQPPAASESPVRDRTPAT